VFSVQLTGGELFAYQGIDKITKKLINNGTNLSLTTSGYILNKTAKETLHLFSQENDVIQVSLDGMSDTHNKFRNKEKSFEKVIKFIKYAVSVGCNVHVATILIHQTIEEMEALCAYVKELGIKEHR
jgi:molybdenum cofactor biosynthesis enzyme MoaA